MDNRIGIFYRQYLQEFDAEKLCFPPDNVLLEPVIQAQMFRYMFVKHLRFPSERPNTSFLPSASYQRRVLKELTRRIEAAIRDPDEDEISSDLMERMATLSMTAEPSPMEAVKTKSILTYSLPSPNQDIATDSIFIEESPNVLASAGTTGLRTWDACLHLATYLVTEGRALVVGKSVIELGVGTGLLSIICAGPLSAAYVLATDKDPKVGETIERNTMLNHYMSKRPGRQIPLESKVLEWGSEADLGSLLPSKGGNVLYDTILGADITYSPDSLEPLASTLSNLAQLCPSADIIISATVRNEDTFDIFLARCLEQGLSVYEVDFRCPQVELQKGLFHALDPPIRIVRIKRER